MKKTREVALFEKKQVRRVWYEKEWWFSVIDVISILTESNLPRRYWSDLKKKIKIEGYSELYGKIVQLSNIYCHSRPACPP